VKIKRLLGEENYLKLKYLFLFSIEKFGLKKIYLEKIFMKKMKYRLSFKKKPTTFNQKIQFRKVYDKNPLFVTCADKYKVREYIKKKIGEEYLIPLYLVSESFSEKQWDNLPGQCVVKVNHNSGPVQIITDKKKADKNKVIKEIERQLKEKYGTLSLETYYSEIKPLVIAEKLLTDTNGEIPKDYKFHCFDGGKKLFVQLDSSRYSGHRQDFFNESWDKVELELISPNSEVVPEKPENLEELKRIARKLAEDFNYVRVDLYNLKGKIYFGELTFNSWSGLTKFKQFEWDEKWGSYWKQENWSGE
jgi:hypothetical protein